MRTRTIKPEFWTDEKLAKVSRETRVFFASLWCGADDQGVSHANPSLLRSQAFPYDLDLEISTIETWLDQLEALKMIKRYEAANGEKYLFISKFFKYQKIDHPAKTLYNPEPREGLAKAREDYAKDSATYGNVTPQTEFKQNLNRIEFKQKQKAKTLSVSKNETDVERFGQFWAQYPRKEKKKTASEAWARAKFSNEQFMEVMSALTKQKKSEQWTKDGGKYVPHPTTWLNGRRWEDEIETENYDESNLNVTQRSVLESRRRRLAREGNTENGGQDNGGECDISAVCGADGQKVITGGN